MANAEISIVFDFGGSDGNPGTNQTVVDENNNAVKGTPNLQWKLADDAEINDLYKVPKPGAGLGPYRSYFKYVYLKMVTASGKVVNNVKMYTGGVNDMGTGIDLKVGTASIHHHAGDTANYHKATGTALSGDTMIGNPGVAAEASVFTFTSASPFSVGINEASSQLDADNELSDYIPFQATVANTCTDGTKGPSYIYFSWDEA